MKNIKFLLLAVFISVAIADGDAQTFSGDTITTKSGLKYLILQPGEGVKPWPNQKVSIFYTVKFKNAKKTFDTNVGETPYKFKVGKGEVIAGLDEGIYLMHVNSKMKFFIPAKLAYGASGLPNPEGSPRYLVPPNTDLIYEVELVGIHK